MRTGDDHLAGPADGELAVIDADRRKNEEPEPDDPEYDRTSHAIVSGGGVFGLQVRVEPDV